MKPIQVMVNGLPGKVATTVGEHILKDDRFGLITQSLTGPEIEESECQIGSSTIRLIHPKIRDDAVSVLKETQSPFISIDFTHPTAVNANAEFYCANKLPFVMGTTGGDRDKLFQTVIDSDICAVIAPNMAKQIVGFQAMMAYASQTFPDLFQGYDLEIRESHQAQKADTSGTAKAMIGYFNRLGTPFTAEQIQKERDPEVQKNRWGIPDRYLSGHGWHTYTLRSSDQTVTFQLTHNVNGRAIYAKGTMDAVIYLQDKINQGASGTVYSMIDVLKND
jgi:4-hydroxy-tetrahydrodipicolinate reductase